MPLAFLAGLASPVYGRNLDHSLAALKDILEAEALDSSGPEPQQPPAKEPEAEAEPESEAYTEPKQQYKNE